MMMGIGVGFLIVGTIALGYTVATLVSIERVLKKSFLHQDAMLLLLIDIHHGK